jgi:hypothetical protein
MLDPIPSLDKIFSIISQQERDMNLTNLPTPPVVAVQSVLSSQGRGKRYSKHGQARRCTHYGQNNHTGDTCFANHGPPPG